MANGTMILDESQPRLYRDVGLRKLNASRSRQQLYPSLPCPWGHKTSQTSAGGPVSTALARPWQGFKCFCSRIR